MSPIAPEAPVGMLQQAPADRPTLQLEEWTRQGMALLFGDNMLDQDEMKILRGFFEEVALRARNGGVGTGATPPAQAPTQMPPNPMEMNQNTQDMGTTEGAEPEDMGGY